MKKNFGVFMVFASIGAVQFSNAYASTPLATCTLRVTGSEPLKKDLSLEISENQFKVTFGTEVVLSNSVSLGDLGGDFYFSDESGKRVFALMFPDAPSAEQMIFADDYITQPETLFPWFCIADAQERETTLLSLMGKLSN